VRAVKRRLLTLLQRLRLLRPAFRGWEILQSVRSRGDETAAADGLPVPPARLRVRVAGTADLGWFLESGRLAEESFRAALARHDVALEDVGALLDFGCGCGRVTRRWASLAGVEINGTDTDAPAVEWCRRNLRFARFETNQMEPPLRFGDESFGLVYALSIFTHLTVEQQRTWLVELARVLRPGGLLLLTTHGRGYLERLSPQERAAFGSGEIVVRWSEAAGTNLCAVYHPEGSLEQLLPDALTFLDFLPEGALGNPTQDLSLVRKG
jgi:SAM-dependent methyltransferase